MVHTEFGHIMAVMQRRFAIYALVAMAVVIFLPEIRGAGEYLWAKSVETNMIRFLGNTLLGWGCF